MNSISEKDEDTTYRCWELHGQNRTEYASRNTDHYAFFHKAEKSTSTPVGTSPSAECDRNHMGAIIHMSDTTECAPAEAYLILEKTPEKSLGIFYDLVTQGIPGLVISRVYPEKLTKSYTLTGTPMVWLSRSNNENSVSPDDLATLKYIIRKFTEKSTESVILLEGLEYLVVETNFESVLAYMQDLRNIAVANNSQLLVSLHKDTLSLGEYSVLKKEFMILQ